MPEDASSDSLIELAQAELELQAAQIVLDGTRIYAPISGTIMEVNTAIGNTVGTDMVIVIADLSQLDLEIYLDASDWDKATVGNEADVTFDASPGQVFKGQVTEVDQELYASFNSTAVRGIVSLAESFAEVNLPIGSTASVDVISGSAENAILVPLEALHEVNPGEYAVYVVENNQPQLRLIKIGLQDQLYAEVKSGLITGELVATGDVEIK